jgi:ribonuclease HII
MRFSKPRPSLEYERAFWRDGYRRVAGLDEAGRGALAGPVVAAVVILPCLDAAQAEEWHKQKLFRAIARANDSKLLSERTREQLFAPICALAAAYAVGSASQDEIDTLNILRASHLAMVRALEALPVSPDALLLDALVLKDVYIPQQGIIHGDALALSIAAASILAKVTRDRMMRELDAQFPHYAFSRNKGYGTPAHLRALRRFGACAVHRRTYAPVENLGNGMPFDTASHLAPVETQ